MTTRAVPDWLTGWEYAHRGLHAPGVPENSLAAAEAAIAAGMGIECDIQFSSDGVPMVFHDYQLEPLVGAPGPIGDRSSHEISMMALLGTDERIPSLAGLLDLLAGRVPLLIEVKWSAASVEARCEALIAALAGYSGPYAIMSFDHWITRWIRENAPDIPCGLVMREDEHGQTQTAEEREFAFAKAEPDFLAYHIAALPNPWVAGLRASGLPVLTWTVNSSETRARALVHADALIAEGEGLA